MLVSINWKCLFYDEMRIKCLYILILRMRTKEGKNRRHVCLSPNMYALCKLQEKITIIFNCIHMNARAVKNVCQNICVLNVFRIELSYCTVSLTQSVCIYNICSISGPAKLWAFTTTTSHATYTVTFLSTCIWMKRMWKYKYEMTNSCVIFQFIGYCVIILHLFSENSKKSQPKRKIAKNPSFVSKSIGKIAAEILDVMQ